jgi:hypothetical protein
MAEAADYCDLGVPEALTPMPVHDWARVSAGVFHDFHGSWIAELKKALNGGILPEGFYAMAEQVAGEISPDVLTLAARRPGPDREDLGPTGATAVAATPPKVRFTASADEVELYAQKRRTLVIRHASGGQVVALLEVLSPGNKNRKGALQRFLDKAISALWRRHHLLLVDLHAPGPHDPEGIHGSLWAEFGSAPYRRPPDKPLTLVAYSAGPVPRAYVEPVAVEEALPAMPLFLEEDWYVNVPLEDTYRDAYASVSERWRRVLEGREA